MSAGGEERGSGPARVTASAGFAYVSLSLASQALIQVGGMEPAFDAPGAEVVTFFEARDVVLFAVGDYLQLLALVAFVWFLGGLWTLVREAEGPQPWRATVLGASGLAFVASLGSGWQLAMLRVDDLDVVTARLSFDLGNLGFANSWVPLASMLVAASLALRRSRAAPSWLAGAAMAIAVGLLLGRAVWTSPVAFAPWVAFWAWVIALGVVLFRGGGRLARPDERGDGRDRTSDRLGRPG
jgi:hypothetical protein